MRWRWYQWALGAACVAAVAVSAVAIGGKQHTKIVTQTRVVTKHIAPPQFNGTLSSLVGFLHPRSASLTKCPRGVPAGTVCVNLGAPKWYVFFAAPAASASS